MGEILGAGIIAHAPTIMFPLEERLAINDGKEITLVPGLERLRSEVLDELKPDTVIVLDTHWFTTVEFIVTLHERRQGKYTSEELPRGMSAVPYDLTGDPELAQMIADFAAEDGVRTTAIDDPYLPIHYPTVNLAHYLQAPGERWITIGVCQTAVDWQFLSVGASIGRAVAASDRRVVILGTGGMSHTFWPLPELPKHEASDPIHIRTPEARAADERRIGWLEAGQHAAVIDAMEDYHQYNPEGFFGHYLMMVGAIGGRDCEVAGRRFSEYENATGTGQVHIWFDRPAAGWAA
ncbi:MAG: catechol 1,2-dioxygenase [Gammaproteobacteria bacterium]|nr:catechol 1,2-dioxygenase [Gammaproteobacteria bacterium]